jgi:hypothetical protein
VPKGVKVAVPKDSVVGQMHCFVGDTVTLNNCDSRLYTVIQRKVTTVPAWYAVQLSERVKNAVTPEERGRLSEHNRLDVQELLQGGYMLLRTHDGERLTRCEYVVMAGASWQSVLRALRVRGRRRIQQLNSFIRSLISCLASATGHKPRHRNAR